MADFDVTESSDQGALKFLCGDSSRSVTDEHMETFDSMEALLREMKHAPSIEMPEFDASNVSDWLSKVERSFRVRRYSDLDKLDLVAFSLEGDTLLWFDSEMTRSPFHSWDEFRHRLFLRFAATTEASSETVTESLEARASYQVPVSSLEPGLSFSTESLVVSEARLSAIVSTNRVHSQFGFESVKNLNNAHHVFDKTSAQKARLKPQSKRKLSLSLKTWMFKFKHTSQRSKSLDVKFFSVEEISWLTKDSKAIYRSCVDKEFNEVVAGCGKKLFDRFQIVDGPSTLAVYDAMDSNIIKHHPKEWGQLILVDLKSHMRHRWKSKPVTECKTTAAIFRRVLERSVSHDCFLGSLWERKNVSWLGVVCVLAECLFAGCSGAEQVFHGLFLRQQYSSSIWHRWRRKGELEEENTRVKQRPDTHEYMPVHGSTTAPVFAFSHLSARALQRVRSSEPPELLAEVLWIHEAVLAVRYDDMGRRELLVQWQHWDSSEASWMLSQDLASLYPAFKLEDKLGFQGGSIDTNHHSFYRKQKQVPAQLNDVAVISVCERSFAVEDREIR